MSPPTHHPGPYSHRAIQVGMEAWIVPSLKQGQLQGQTWLLLALSCVIFKPSEDGDCTVWALWGPQLNCLHGKQAPPRIQVSRCRMQSPSASWGLFWFCSKIQKLIFHIPSNSIYYAVLLTELYCYLSSVEEKKSSTCDSSGATSEAIWDGEQLV